MKKKNILIAGGTGQVGQNLKTSFANNNLEGIFVGKENGKYDLTDFSKTKQLFYDKNPSIVVFLSANVGGIGYNKSNPASLIRDNLKMGINMLDACAEFAIENLYITSTCCSYPKFCSTPQKEDDLWEGQEEKTNRSYGVAKKTIITMSQAYREQFGLKTTCFVLANLYGLYDTFDPTRSHVVPALIKKFIDAKNNDKPTVECWGSGTATRDLLFSSDVSELFAKVITNRFDHEEPINLGSGKDVSIYDLAYLIKDLCNYHGEIVFTGEVSDGQPKRLLDVSRAKKLLDWQATTDLRSGLIKTIDWYRKSII
jgi:GDP-L-fucose synthase